MTGHFSPALPIALSKCSRGRRFKGSDCLFFGFHETASERRPDHNQLEFSSALRNLVYRGALPSGCRLRTGAEWLWCRPLAKSMITRYGE
jgi:hypothetical protein